MDKYDYKVSVVVPTFNRPEFLKLTLESLVEQTFVEPFDVIVVNDFGEDVFPIVNSFDDKLAINYISHSKNQGLAAARNTGIRHSHGKYICYLDDDDIFYPNHLAILYSTLDSRGLDIAYTDAFKAVGSLQNGVFLTESRLLEYSKDIDRNEILVQNCVPVLCYMHTRTALERTGMFDESFEVFEDWDLLGIRMSKFFRHVHIKQPTAEYRWHPSVSPNMSGVANRPPNFFRDYFARMYIKHLGQGNQATIAYRKKWLENQGFTLQQLGEVPSKKNRRGRR